MNHTTQWSSSDVGGLCWVSDTHEAYLEATVDEVSKDVVKATTSDGRSYTIDLKAPLAKPKRGQKQPKEPPRRILQREGVQKENGFDDMDEMHMLHEASILNNIETRFRLDCIYSNCGPILIAMNPFKWLPLYGEEMIKRYRNQRHGSLPPHAFAESEDALQQLVHKHVNQAIVICGESGAGKTETTKLMLHYLAVVAKSGKAARRSSKTASVTEEPTIAERMVASNPLLEALGNAKTLRNNNSSRFGKFTRLDFSGDAKPEIVGGQIDNILLEKSRVVFQPSGERNFHIFYQALAAVKGSDPLLGAGGAATLGGLSGDPAEYHYTNQSGCMDVEGMDDLEEFGLVKAALSALAVEEPTQLEILKIIAGLLHLGQVEFEDAPSGSDASVVTTASKASLDKAAQLMAVKDSDSLAGKLVTRVRELRGGETVTSNNTPSESQDLRDALAKFTFSKLFDWIVTVANMAFDAGRHSGPKEPRYIGVLDIFGFEDMKVNGFEQLFINTTNEQLQRLFNDIIFKQEAAEYERESIEWDRTAFPDNMPCIELLSKKPHGLLRVLDNECLRGMAASDGDKLVSKFNKQHGSHANYDVCGPASVFRRKDGKRTEENDFLIHHFAGPVIYTVTDFIDKNRDALFGHLYDAMASSSSTVMLELYPPRGEVGGKSGSMTVSNKFLGQLTSLVAMLKESSTRFVRCIKTNEQKVPSTIDKPSVLRQLVCSGVMAALEVRRAGFPTRVTYKEFVRDFRVFTPRERTSSEQELTSKMLQHPQVTEKISASMYRLGVSKLFMQAEVLYTLQTLRDSMWYPFVRRLQRWWIKTQGNILDHKLTRAGNALASLDSRSTTSGVRRLPIVAGAIEPARDAYAKAATPGQLSRDAITELTKLIDKATEVVDRAVKQKEAAFRARAELFGILDGGSARVEALKSIVEDLYEPQAKKELESAWKDASKQIIDCRTEITTAVTSWEQQLLESEEESASKGGATGGAALGGLRRSRSSMRSMQIDNDSGTKKKTLDHAALKAKVEEALQSVAFAEMLSQKLLEMKRAMDEARKQYQGALDTAAERLTVIPVDQFIIAGIVAVKDAVSEARDMLYKAQKAMQEIDAEAMVAAVNAASAAVEAALICAEQESQRVQAISELDQDEQALDLIEHSAQELALLDSEQFTASLKVARDSIGTARAACSYPDIAVLQGEVDKATQSVQDCQEILDSEQRRRKEEQKNRFNKHLAIFQQGEKKKNEPKVFARETPNRRMTMRTDWIKQPVDDGKGRGAPLFQRPIAKPAPIMERPTFTPPPPPPSSLSSSPAPAPSAPAPAPTSGSAAGGGPSLSEWITQHKMDKYKDNLLDLASSLDDLREMTDEDVAEFAAECGIPKLPLRRFKKALAELGASVTTD